MGKNKINLEKKITKKDSRSVTYYKRKMGIIRKCIQMSKLCDKKILLLVYDEKMHRMV